MAKIGFRSSMFGFNKADVNMYLMKIQQEYALKEQELSQRLSNLESENSELNKKIADLEKQNAEFAEKCNDTEAELRQTQDELNRINGEFSYLKGKEQEIEEMSESIGTMYMVAMQNAGEIISSAETCAREINEASSLRLEAAARAEEQLKAIKEGIKASAEQIAEDINALSLSLEGPKNRLAEQLEIKANPALPEFYTEFKKENE